MIVASIAKSFTGATLSLLLLWFSPANASALIVTSKQKSLDEWRSLTAPPARPPKVFVKGDTIRFFFETETNRVGFSAHWSRLRLPIEGYKAHSAQLHLEPKLSRRAGRRTRLA